MTVVMSSLPEDQMRMGAGLRDLLNSLGSTFVDETDLTQRLRSGVADVVRQQIAAGIDIVNDGDLSKTSFTDYVRTRLDGLDPRPAEPYASSISRRDMQAFPEYFDPNTGFPHTRQGGRYTGRMRVACTGPLIYTGQAAVRADIETFQAALQGATVEEAFLPAIAPGTIEHWHGLRPRDASGPSQDYLVQV